ncbi:fibronectin type III domain-containing protein [uncultured Friedmanniella sp.]|uniref:DUF7927 domain-containing protein n=1 Tax=uncultured Friedmanniella sp. TaxID=335381 RepID=UPI0035CBF28C
MLLVVLSLVLGVVGTTGITTGGAPQAQAAAPGLVGRWTLDNGSGTAATDSVGGRTATLNSGAGWGTGVQGTSALTTNGTTGAAVTSSAVLNTSTSFTVSAYVKVNALNGANQTVVSQDGNAISGFLLQLRGDTLGVSKLATDSSSATTAVAVASTKAVVGQWYHIATVYDSTANTLAFYLNGRLQQTVTSNSRWNATGNFAIGRAKYNGVNTDWLNGTTDDVRAYSQALGSDDISHLSEAAHWNLDEGTGTTAADDSLNQFAGTLTNGPTWGPGVIGPSSVDFDGSNDDIEANGSVIDTSKSFSVSAWARTNQLTSARIVASVDASNYSGFTLSQTNTGRWVFSRASSNVTSPTVTASVGPVATVGTWYHLTGVYDSVAGTLTLYVDGTKQTSASYTSGWKATGNFIIGRSRAAGAPVGYFDGSIDEVRVFPYVVDDATATALAAPPAPPVPATPTATITGTTINLSWVAPAPVSGSPTTGYLVTPYINGTAGSALSFGTSTSQSFGGAAANTSYRYTVAAINANGTSAPSGQSAAVSYTVPNAPVITDATASGSRTANLTWNAPGSNGGSAITGYRVTPYLGSTAQATQTFGAGSAGTAQSVTGLTPAATYTFKVAAQNAAGYGTDSAASSPVTLAAAAPGTMAAPTASARATSASVSWVPPAANGSAITGYVVTPYIGTTAQPAQTFTSTATTQQVTGLTAGTAYTFTVSAVNAVGTGTASAKSAAVTPFNVPGPPAVTAVSAAIQGASLTWTAPVSDGGSAITGYRVTPSVNGVAQTPVTFGAGAAGAAQTVTGLTAGKSYTFTVAAQNVGGYGAESAASAAVTPTAQAPTSAPPQSTQGGAYSFQFTITGFTAPYAYTVSDGTLPPGLTLSANGLLSGTPTAAGTYVWTVRIADASNSLSRTVTQVVAAPPTVTFNPAGGVVGAAYSSQPTVADGTGPFTWTVPTGSLPAGLGMNTTTGLISGTPTVAGSFSVTVQAADSYNVSGTRAVTIVVTDRPSTPTAPTATAGIGAATVAWVAPASNGSALTGYVVTPYLNGAAQPAVSYASTATTQTLTGLTVGGTYTFTVAAVNALGTSPESAQSTAVTPYGVPGRVTPAPTATANTLSATLSWTAPAGNGSPITGYVVTPYIGTTAQAVQSFSGTATTRTVTGLTAGTAYTFTVAAQNAAGTGPESAASTEATPNAVPALTFPPPPAAAVGVAYSQQLPVEGGTSPFVWTLVNGNPPPGITLSSAGVLSGTATAIGTVTFEVKVTDASGRTAGRWTSQAAIDKPAAPASPTATAGLTSAVLSWVAPAANNSVITGYVITPFLAGVAQPVINVDPSAKTRTLNGLTAGGSYTFKIAAVNAAGTSTLSGSSNTVTPFAALNAPTITSVTAASSSARLSWTAPSSNGGSAITGYVVTPYIGGTAQTPQTFASTATTQTVTGLTPGTAYTFRVAATNLSGTNVLYRVHAGGVQVAANDGGPDWAADNTVTNPLRTTGSNAVGYPPGVVADDTVPASTPNAVFDSERFDEMAWAFPVATGAKVKARLYFVNHFAGTDSPGSRVFDVTLEGSTVLPDFDVIPAAGGTMRGTMREFAVTSDGTVDIGFIRKVQAPMVTALEIIQTGLATTGPPSTSSAAVTPNASPTLSFPAPPSGEVGVAYSRQLTVTDGTAPFVWSVSAGTLPAGLTLSSTGLLSGTPTVAGTSTFTVQVTDSSGSTATRAVSLVVEAALAQTLSPVAGEVGVAYSYQPVRTGGVAPYTWAVSAGTLPAGLSLNPSTGLISGTPTTPGTSTVTVAVTDSLAQVVNKTASVVIAAAPTLTSSPPAGQSGEPYTYTFVATGGTGPFTYSVVTGALPNGFTLTSAGVLSGSTSVVANTSFTVQVVDAFGLVATRAVTLVIGPAPVSVVKTADVATTTPGSVVRYTITVTNSSSTRTYAGAQITDPLTDVTDDADFNDDAAATVGTVTAGASGLQWNLDIAPSSSATLTYTVTVANPGTGDKVLKGTVSTANLSTNCNPGTPTSACTSTVNISSLTIVKSADVATTTPGSTVRFTIVATNSGKTAYTGASLSDSLAAVLDDATFNQNATTTVGSLTYVSPTLSWTGNLAVGASTTISYTVTVKNPDPGNKVLTGGVVSTTPGNTCPSANPAASCRARVTVLVPALTITNTAAVTTTTPGAVVPHTLTLTNTGETPYTSVTVNDALAGALDDATYAGDATTSDGSLSYDTGSQTLVWTGDLAIGASVTITVPLTVRDPDPGNKILTSVASSDAAGSSCPSGSMNTACTAVVQVLVPALTITTSSNVGSTTPGSVVAYTVLVTNTGQTPYAGATFTDSLTGVLDDASYTNDGAATVGSLSYSAPDLTWTGDLAVGASATITYTVTVDNPDTGDRSLSSVVASTTQGNNCVAGSVDPRCTSVIPVLLPALSLTITPDVATATPGGVVRYTVSATNAGQTTYTGAVLRLNFTGLYDDASYNKDASVTRGSFQPALDGSVAWTLDLAPGDNATARASFTVKSPATGDKSMIATMASDAPGSNCAAGSTQPGCQATTTVQVPGLTITKTADVSTVLPGGRVSYTVVVTNTGESAYAAARFDDPLADVLADATYDGGVTWSSGTLTFVSSTLSWTGALAPGASATIAYSLVVRDPDPGDKRLTNTVVSSSEGSNCPTGGTDTRCTADVIVQVPQLTIVKTASTPTTAPGAQVAYTVKVTNSGDTSYPAANVADPLAGVLDDATYNGDVLASAGSASVTADVLGWSGSLAVGATATITYSVTVNATAGDNVLTNTVTSTSRGNNCPTSGTDTRCTTSVPVARLLLVRSPAQATTTPGSVVYNPVTFTNVGKVPYIGISVIIPRLDTADDVFSTGPDLPSSGTLSSTTEETVWIGDIPVGGVVTIAFTRTVKNPDTGNKIIASTMVSSAAGNNCPAGGTDPRCSMSIPVLVPALTVTKAASTTQVEPGASVGYTITVRNTGQTAYSSAVVKDAMVGALDDATYAGNAVATSGTLSYVAPNLFWTGDLAVGATATITYSMTALTFSAGDKDLRNTVSSTEAGSSCPPASSAAACVSSVDLLTPALTLTTSADLTNATLGATVTYTVLVTNTGQTSYPSASFSSSLTGVLDDATYNGDATASGGTADYSGGVLTWTGGLSPGDSVTITYTVTVNSPSSGDRSMISTVVSSAAGSNCALGSVDTGCTVAVNVTNAVSLTFTKTASAATAAAGGVVTYTVKVLNSSAAAVDGVDFTDDLTDVLDDASFNGDAAASTGTVTFTTPSLTWTGTVPAGGTVTVTYSVTARSVKSGNDLLISVLSSPSVPESNNCVAGSVDTRCTSTVPVARLDLRQYADETTTTPGSVVHLTQTYTNTGQSPYFGISVSSPRADTSDDTVPTGDQVASSGTVVRTPTELRWTGDIPVGGTVTITRTLIVKDPDPGNQVIRATLTSTARGSNCPSGTADPRCSFSITVLTPGLTISTTADAATVVPSATVGYTITVTNTGQTHYTAATVTDTLSGVLDDATYDGTATASTGTVSYTAPELRWTGDLAVGDTATITFSVTAHRPADGDKTMSTRVSSTDPGSTCPPASSNAACVTRVEVRTPALLTVLIASRTSAKPGDVVTYTVTATNTGQTDYATATFNLALTGLLDDASYDGNAIASSGSVVRNGQSLDWTGPLAMGESATITYAVTVSSTVTGNHRLEQTLTSVGDGSNCPAGSTDPRCASSVPIASLLIGLSSDLSVAKPTDVVHYTNTFTNTGQVPYQGITVTTNVLGAADDASYNGDAAVTAGSVAIIPGARLVWTGDLAVGATVTLTASVSVKNPDPGDKLISSTIISDAPGSNCPTGGTDPACRSDIPVLTPSLAISKTADQTTTTPGGIVSYTITVHNTGQTAYAGAVVTDFLGGVTRNSDDADYTGVPTATTGSVAFTDPGLRWTGDLALNQTVLITYSVLVDDPDLGDKSIVNIVSSDELGSTCPSGSTSPTCTVTVAVLVPKLDVGIVADRTTTTPGGTVAYTVTVRNTGQTPYAGASVNAALAGVLDDASYAGGATSTAGGTFAFANGSLTWTGDLAVGATAVLGYRVTVASPDSGNRQLTTVVTSPNAGSTCSTDTDCVNTVTVLIPGLAISTTADVATATPGDRVTYTVTLANTGQTPYVDLTANTSLADVTDDAVLVGIPAATLGVASYTAPNLRWTGSLPVGATAVVTYVVLVRSPDPGDKLLRNLVVADVPGSTCPTVDGAPSCTTSVSVLVPALTITKSASAATSTPGGTIIYSINVSNTGQTDYARALVSDSLSGVLPDATFNADATATGGGALSYVAPTLTWTGDLVVGASATITYSVTVRSPDPGDKYITNAVTSSAPGSSCPPGNTEDACTTAVTVLVPKVDFTQTVDRSSVSAGGTVSYTITATNSGETAYPSVTFSDPLAGVLDDADYAADATASIGTVSVVDGILVWTGPLDIGSTATITYSVRTRFPALGDRMLTNAVVSGSEGSNCVTGLGAACQTAVSVLVPALTISKTADRSEVVGRGTVSYTIIATNTGEADYPDATLTDSLDGVLDDAAYNGDVTAGRGTASFAGDTLTWHGALAQGDEVVISYSVTVDTAPTGDSVLRNAVVSTSVGSTCPDGGASVTCSTSTVVDAAFIGLIGLTPSFTLTGSPGSTVTVDNAVVLTVDTNSLAGYGVTVQGTGGALEPRTAGNADEIPLDQLRVRESGDSAFTPLSAESPFVVHRRDVASDLSGDQVSNDYQVSVPFVASDTYETQLEYIVTAQ